jgi:hypothetical protein
MRDILATPNSCLAMEMAQVESLIFRVLELFPVGAQAAVQ